MRVILGGGLGGLSAAHYLLKKFAGDGVTLFEATRRTGGWIRTQELPNGVLFHQAARTIRPGGVSGSNTLQLIDELGIANYIVPIPRTHPAAKTRMIYANKTLCVLPSGIIDLLTTMPPFKKPLLVHLMKDLFTSRKLAANNDESTYDFMERRFGKDVAEYLISPLICGICAGDAKDISVKFLLESFFDYEQKHGSVTRGILNDFFKKRVQETEVNNLAQRARKENWSIYSLKGGLDLLPRTLEKSIRDKGATVELNKTCTDIEFVDDGIVLHVEGVEQIKARHVISSISSQNISTLLKKNHPELAQILQSIPCVTVAVINLQYNKKLKIKDAFGFLVPPSENIPILGVIFDTCCFPDPKNTVLTVMMGGKWFEKYFGESATEEDLLKVALDELKKILDINDEPDNFKVNILHKCIPQYTVGHKDRVYKIEKYIKDNKLPLSLCGFSYHGIGVNDVILSAKKTVMALQK